MGQLAAVLGVMLYMVIFAAYPFGVFVLTIVIAPLIAFTYWGEIASFLGLEDSGNERLELTVREEVRVITKTLLSNPDLDCGSTMGNKLTIEESCKIHFKRLDKYGRSRSDGEMEYMGPRGGIYIYTARGNRSYRWGSKPSAST